MRLAVACIALTLAGCQNSPTDEVLLAKAIEDAAMPDCNSMRVKWAYQRPEDDGYLIVARFTATASCMDRWGTAISESGEFESFTHGGTVPKDPNSLVDNILGPYTNGAVVIWKRHAPMAGLKIMGPPTNG